MQQDEKWRDVSAPFCRKYDAMRSGRVHRPHPSSQSLDEIEAIRVHDLGPGCGEVLDELLLGVGLGIDFRKGT
jgi:hypothetical protein